MLASMQLTRIGATGQINLCGDTMLLFFLPQNGNAFREGRGAQIGIEGGQRQGSPLG